MNKRFKNKFLIFSLWGCFLVANPEKKLNLDFDKAENLLHPVLINSKQIETIFGNITLEHPLMEELHESIIMQRIKKIDQSGPNPYFGLCPYFNRYDHCMGVLYLLQKNGFSILEQIVGMLHDASHTAFSHLADTLFYGKEKEKAYQDEIHLSYLEKQGIKGILNKYNVDIDLLDPDLGIYDGLEQSLPYMCADRIEYNIHTGIILNKITKIEGMYILDHLHFDHIEKRWYFDNIEAAKLFGNLSVYFTEFFWGGPQNAVLYKLFSDILKRALELNLIDLDKILFGVDQDIIDILNSSDDLRIKELLKKINNIDEIYSVVDEDGKREGDIFYSPKCRAIDPLVLYNKKGYTQYKKELSDQSDLEYCFKEISFLSDVDKEYAKSLENVRNFCKKGYYIHYL